MPTVDRESLIRHLSSTCNVAESVLERIVEEIEGSQNETVEEYVRLRHLELQRQGIPNDTAYRVIMRELPSRRFRAPELSARQVRRIIYG